MENNIQEVKNTSENASTGENAVLNSQVAATDNDEVLKKLDEVQNELSKAYDAKEKAESAVVRYKKLLKDSGFEEAEEKDNTQQIAEIVGQELRKQLEPFIPVIQNKNNDLSKANQTIEELKASLIAKNTKSNTGLGVNQDKQNPEEDLTKNISDADKVVYQRIATRKGLSLNDYLKTLPEFRK